MKLKPLTLGWRDLVGTVLALSLLPLGGEALADPAATEQVRAQLIASVEAVHPGEKILVGLHQQLAPHWHTYWVNPGDAGARTRIAWSLPPGAAAGDIQWPVPTRFSQGSVTSYGYENEVTLLSEITVPQEAQAGAEFALKARANWLVCQELCIPQQVDLALVLPIVASGQPAGADQPLIDKARSRLPLASRWPVQVESTREGLTLKVIGLASQSPNLRNIGFYPQESGQLLHAASQPWLRQGDDIVLGLQAGEAPPVPGESLSGILVVTENAPGRGVARGYGVKTTLQGVAAHKATASAPAPAEQGSPGLAAALLLALLGGLILNLMPCVFPILSIKALSLLQHAKQTRLQAGLQGLVYTLGVLASFALLGGLLIVLKAGGAQIGWGFQFQSPLFVLAVAYLMFAVGLSLSGVFSVGHAVAGVGSSLAARPGYAGSFFTGVLATIVATPCTAPFMGGALGYALTQPPVTLMAVFLSLGLGLALPYLLLSTWPWLQRCLPRPGRWMERVKQVLAFPMYGAAVWLVWVLAQQVGPNAIVFALGGMVVIAFAAWLYETTRGSSLLGRHSGTVVTALALTSALAGGYLGIQAGPANAAPVSNRATAGKTAQAYSAERLQALRAQGKPVFVNFTAAWCITCLVNERVALSDRAVTEAFAQSGITYLKGDWTNQDPQITRQLAGFGRSGVPLYVFYPAGLDAKPVVLPQLLTPAIVLAALNPPPG